MPMARTSSRNIGPYPLSAPYRGRKGTAAKPAKLEIPIEEWRYLDEAVLLKTRSLKVCMTCHWVRHHAGVNCIPVLTSDRRCLRKRAGSAMAARCSISSRAATTAGARAWR